MWRPLEIHTARVLRRDVAKSGDDAWEGARRAGVWRPAGFGLPGLRFLVSWLKLKRPELLSRIMIIATGAASFIRKTDLTYFFPNVASILKVSEWA